jgi:hypothetical protein
MKYLIGKRVINADHIVLVEYSPASIGIDDETNESYTRRADCRITLTSTYLKESADYDGAVNGVAAVSDFLTLCNTEADLFWEAYINDAYTVVNP